jgi:hypothetical protein
MRVANKTTQTTRRKHRIKPSKNNYKRFKKVIDGNEQERKV